jgi:hypothetical protein
VKNRLQNLLFPNATCTAYSAGCRSIVRTTARFVRKAAKVEAEAAAAVGEVSGEVGDSGGAAEDVKGLVMEMLSPVGLALFTTLFCSQNTFD